MKFYKLTQNINSFKKGDVFCNSFWYGLIKCATSKEKTKYRWGIFYNFPHSQLLDLFETKILVPLTKTELLKLTPHLKKEVLKYDYPISLKNEMTLEENYRIRDEVKSARK